MAAASLLVKWTVPVYALAVLLNWSCAVTVKLMALPAVAVVGPLTAKWLAAAVPTAMALLVPVIELVAVSVAVSVWLPAVFNVALKEPVPLIKALLLGSTA